MALCFWEAGKLAGATLLPDSLSVWCGIGGGLVNFCLCDRFDASLIKVFLVGGWAKWLVDASSGDTVIPEFSGVGVVIAFNFKDEVVDDVISKVKESVEWSKGSNGELLPSIDLKLGLGEAEEHHTC